MKTNFLYTFTRISQWNTEMVQVIAENEEEAKKILSNDGREPMWYSLETTFKLHYSEKEIGIPFSFEVENPNYEG